MKKLFEVEVHYYVMAEDAGEAKRGLLILALEDCMTVAYEAFSVDASWRDAIPFGSDDDQTCGQIMAERQKRLPTPAEMRGSIPDA